MPRINLDELIPEDIEFAFKGETYTIPGDLDTHTTFRIIDLFEREQQAELDTDRKQLLAVTGEITALLLELFQRARPDLEELPFGVMAYRHICSHILVALGLQIVEDTPVPPTPANREQRRATTRSRRSTGSPK